MNIIYGGSFNPPTIAHKKIIELILFKYNPEHLILVPTSAKYTHKYNLVKMEDRIAMLSLLTDDPRVLFSKYEDETKVYEGTYKTLIHFKNIYKNIYFVMGADNLDYISEWLNSKKLIKEFNFIVIGRKDFNLKSILDKEVDSEYQDNFSLLSLDIDVSSSQVRSNVDLNKNMLTHDVYEYIKKNRLYEEKK